MKNNEELILAGEDKLSWIIKHITNVFYISTVEDDIIYISPQVNDILGYTQAEALVKWTEFVTNNPINNKGVENTRKAILTGESQPPYEMELLRKDGKKIWVEVRETPITENGGVSYITGSLTDITQRKKSELVQKTLFNISNAVMETEDLDELYQRIHQLLNEVVNVRNFFIALIDEQEQKIQFPYYESKYDAKPEPVRITDSRGLTQYVLDKGEAILVSRSDIEQMYAHGDVGLRGKVPLQWLGVPLKIGKTVIGVISVQSFEEPYSYSDDDVELLTFVSEEIALVIRSKQTEEQIKGSLREKETLLRELYHRTRNNMEVIASMLNMKVEISQNEVLKASFQEIVNKIYSMSLVHKKLYDCQNLSQINLKEYLESFTKYMMDRYDQDKVICFKLKLNDVKASIDSAMPLGLVIAELTTNAFKHAFLPGQQGEIRIELYRDQAGLIVVELADNGIGIDASIDLRALDSMGINTAYAIVKYQLRGTITYQVSQGLKWKIVFSDEDRKKRI